MVRKTCIVFCCMLATVFSAPAASTPLSLDSLLRRHIDLRFGVFMHFNMNTYVAGWANARVNPLNFNPTSLNCAQWASAAKAAKMTYGLLTAKHHDGFTLWPSKQKPPNGQSQYTIAQSSQPTMDVVQSYTDAFRAAGLLPGLYFSMWDVANGVTGWSAAERTFVLGQLTELLGGKYGEIPILVIDGWAWKMGHQTIPYKEIRDTIKKMQPNILMVDHNGLLYGPWDEDIFYVEEPKGLYCPTNNTQAACQGATISGNWFWDANAANSASLMRLDSILDHLGKLEPRYCNFLLNCPPNKSGVFDAAIVTRLTEVGNKWSPNASRAPLPKPPFHIEYPLTPVSATGGTNPNNTIEGIMDAGSERDWTGAVGGTITLDFGSIIQNIGTFGYLPKQSGTDGEITGYTISTSTDNTAFTTVKTGTWATTRSPKVDTFPRVAARYVKLTIGGVNSGSPTIDEIGVGMRPIVTTGVFYRGKTPVSNSTASGNSIYRTSGTSFIVPKQFAGKTVTISIFDLSGHFLYKSKCKGNVFDFGKKTMLPEAIYLVKINES